MNSFVNKLEQLLKDLGDSQGLIPEKENVVNSSSVIDAFGKVL